MEIRNLTLFRASRFWW